MLYIAYHMGGDLLQVGWEYYPAMPEPFGIGSEAQDGDSSRFTLSLHRSSGDWPRDPGLSGELSGEG